MKAQTQKLMPTLHKGTLLGSMKNVLAIQLPPYPRATPNKAPVSDITMLSMRNWFRMKRKAFGLIIIM